MSERQKNPAGFWRGPLLGWIFLTAGFVFVVWWLLRTPPPNYSLIAMAVAAGLMALRYEPPSKERSCWAVLLILFAVIEIKAIRKDTAERDKRQAAEQAELQKNFAAIGDGIKNSIQTGQSQFKTTMDRTDVLLNNITGGDAYCYLVPIPPVMGANDFEQLAVGNSGNVVLPTCTIRLVELPSPTDTSEQAVQKFNQPPISLQNVPPRRQGARYIQYGIHAGPDHKYEAVITPPTRSFVELISFKLNSAGTSTPVCELRSPDAKLLKNGCDTLPQK